MNPCRRNRESGFQTDRFLPQFLRDRQSFLPFHRHRSIGRRVENEIRPSQAHQFAQQQRRRDAVMGSGIDRSRQGRVGDDWNIDLRIGRQPVQHVITVSQHIQQEGVRARFDAPLRLFDDLRDRAGEIDGIQYPFPGFCKNLLRLAAACGNPFFERSVAVVEENFIVLDQIHAACRLPVEQSRKRIRVISDARFEDRHQKRPIIHPQQMTHAVDPEFRSRKLPAERIGQFQVKQANRAVHRQFAEHGRQQGRNIRSKIADRISNSQQRLLVSPLIGTPFLHTHNLSQMGLHLLLPPGWQIGPRTYGQPHRNSLGLFIKISFPSLHQIGCDHVVPVFICLLRLFHLPAASFIKKRPFSEEKRRTLDRSVASYLSESMILQELAPLMKRNRHCRSHPSGCRASSGQSLSLLLIRVANCCSIESTSN